MVTHIDSRYRTFTSADNLCANYMHVMATLQQRIWRGHRTIVVRARCSSGMRCSATAARRPKIGDDPRRPARVRHRGSRGLERLVSLPVQSGADTLPRCSHGVLSLFPRQPRLTFHPIPLVGQATLRRAVIAAIP